MKMRAAALLIVVNLMTFGGLLLLLEATGQAVALMFPSYDVLFLQPDRVLGWKQVPNLEWTWAGHHWYAADFAVRVKTNSMGFRDHERRFDKPANVIRVAVIGDSFIEAVQVPLERTATQVLERKLNESSAASGLKYEVLNFGISNYGIGQYLLTWREYVRKFSPNYAAIFVAALHMRRTVQKYSDGAFPGTERRRLWIRPVFSLSNGELTLEAARDYEEFGRVQAELVRTVFDGGRSRRRHRLVTLHYAGVLATGVRESIADMRGRVQPAKPEDDRELIDINLAILEKLKQETAASGTRLAVIDVSGYFGDERTVSGALKRFCGTDGLTYVPVSETLLEAARNGENTRWSNDGHFNEGGNTILADALFKWIQEQEVHR
jgi:lysophospholipase L1-like esterase